MCFFIRIKIIQSSLHILIGFIFGSFAVTRLARLTPGMHSHANCNFTFYTDARDNKGLCAFVLDEAARHARASERASERTQAYHRKSIEVIVETIKWRYSYKRAYCTPWKKKEIVLLHATFPARMWLRWYWSDVSCYTDITHINFCRRYIHSEWNLRWYPA